MRSCFRILFEGFLAGPGAFSRLHFLVVSLDSRESQVIIAEGQVDFVAARPGLHFVVPFAASERIRILEVPQLNVNHAAGTCSPFFKADLMFEALPVRFLVKHAAMIDN